MRELLEGLRRLEGPAEALEDSSGRVAASALRALPFAVDLVSGGEGGDQMLAFLNQEILRYDGLLQAVAGLLRETIEVCEGRVICTPAVEAASRSLARQRVPEAWLARSYLSVKSLAAYLADLAARLDFIRGWAADGRLPSPVWISGLFSIQAFP